MNTTRSINRPGNTRSLAAIAAVLCVGSVLAQTNNIAINRNGAAPNPFAILDVQSTAEGVLIPRMDETQRNAIVAPAQGLTVYVTAPTNEEGFWYFDVTWRRVMPGSPWTLSGNTGTVPGTGVGQNYLGTSDAQPLVFRTNNVERARLDVTGNFGIGVVAPVEELDVNGAIMQTGTAATNTAGTIRFTQYNAVQPIAPSLPYSQSYHEGNLNGTPTGWRKLENDYTEVKGASYSAAGSPVVCNPGAVDLAVQNGVSNDPYVTPWNVTTTATAGRFRHQYLFRPDELNVELNQLFYNPSATGGICCGAQISSIAVNITTYTGQKTGSFSVAIKHTGSSSLTAFDNTVDPAGRCVVAASPEPDAGAGWKTYTFATPFVWDCTRGIIIEFLGATAAAGVATNNTVAVRTGLPFNATYATFGTVACGTTGACGSNTTASCGTIGPSTTRPVVRFGMANAGVSSAPPATAATGDFVHYDGAFIAEGGTPNPLPPPPNWSQQTVPYYAFKGPGTISAQSGVYDDNVRLSDHVFDRHFDGRVMASDAAMHGEQRNLSIDEMASFTEQFRHLPTMKGRQEWEKKGGFGLGDLTNQMWATTETQALYLTELNERVDGLAVLSGTGPITMDELNAGTNAVIAMGTLTEAEKAILINGMRERLTTTNNR